MQRDSRTDRGSAGRHGQPARPTGARTLVTLSGVSVLLLLALALASILAAEHSADRNRQLLLRAAEQRQLTQELAAAAGDAAHGDERAFALLTGLRERFAGLHRELMARLSSPGLPPSGHVVRAADTAAIAWHKLRGELTLLEGARGDILRFRELADRARHQIEDLQRTSRGIAELLTDTGAAPRTMLDAAIQLLRVHAMAEALVDVLAGDDAAAIQSGTATADAFAAALDDLQLPAAPALQPQGADALRRALDEMRQLYGDMRANAESLVALLPAAGPALEAEQKVRRNSARLEQALQELAMALRAHHIRPRVAGVAIGTESALVFGTLAVALLGLLGLQQLVLSRRRARFSQAQNEANQAAIQRLLDEMGELADGDLTVHATVTDDMTGAIAESVNYAVRALRALVATINATSKKLNDAARRTRDAAVRLTSGSDAQAGEIERASGSITAVTAAIDEIAGNAAESAAVASRAVLVAGRGAQAVRDTIDGMSAITGPIQETSRRIKRLGSSSQEIGEIVELIDDIADQTNILALNAAMQAAMAGEAGRGFAVVADEVQRLAERASSATKQIEAIVRTIRSDTSEAVRSMETSMTGLINGTKVAENAGTALREIENVSNYIADLTRRIADSAGNESRAAAKVNETVKSILAITRENARGTRETAKSVEALAALAGELQHSVAGFRLPAD